MFFEKAFGIFFEGMSDIKDAISSFSPKFTKIPSAVREGVSNFLSRANIEAPPYSLCDRLVINLYE